MPGLRLVLLAGADGSLLVIPALVAALSARRFRVRDPVLVIGAALGGLALHGSIVYWSYYLFSDEGRFVGRALLVLEVAVAGAILMRRRRLALQGLRVLVLPLALVLTSSLFVLSYGLVRGGDEAPVQAAASRFLPQLPIDNDVPFILAGAVESDARPLPDPLYSGWSPSDRPPLQTGIYLSATSVLGHDASSLQYSVVASLLQSLWVLGLWAFFVAARTPRPLAALVFAATLFSGFALLNTLFVWPKLLSASFLLVIAGMLLPSRSRELLAERGSGVVLGLDAAGALLAHTGALLGLIALAGVMLVRRQWPAWRLVTAAALVAAVLLAPWVAYQKFGDPPGDKLLRMEVADTLYTDTRRPLLRELVDHYRRIGLGRAVHNKLQNLEEPFRGADNEARDAARLVGSYVHVDGLTPRDRGAAVLDLRTQIFFRLVPALGVTALGPILLPAAELIRRRRRGRSRRIDANRLWSALPLFLAFNLVTWALILFGPASTVLHAGTYLTPLLAFVLCVYAWWELAPRAAVVLVVCQAAGTLYLYKDLPPGRGRPFFAAGGAASVAVLLVLSLVAVLTCLAVVVRPEAASRGASALRRRHVGSPGGTDLPT